MLAQFYKILVVLEKPESDPKSNPHQPNLTDDKSHSGRRLAEHPMPTRRLPGPRRRRHRPQTPPGLGRARGEVPGTLHSTFDAQVRFFKTTFT